jgi:hypothetical protein
MKRIEKANKKIKEKIPKKNFAFLLRKSKIFCESN